MARYLFLQSSDPLESAAVEGDLALARDLAANGDAVTVMLVHNGVLATRRGARGASLDALAESGVRVLADAFSLRERAIDAGTLRRGVEPSSFDVVVDALAAGDKVLWL
jgi:NAD(P)H-hydrate repair Nnr-like enzyme with NAD(P)H-hydrate epimerase domain